MFRIGMSELIVLGIVCLGVGISLGIGGTGLLLRGSRQKKDDQDKKG